MQLGKSAASLSASRLPAWLVRSDWRERCDRPFYGWWIVAVCLIANFFGNALGLFGAGVYLHILTGTKPWSTSLVSGAITVFYVTSALLLIPVGGMIGRYGPRPVFTSGALALAAGVVGIGHAEELWQVYAGFLVAGTGWACLSTTAVATALAPWFERYQGRAISIALLGASAAGVVGVPVLLFGIESIGFGMATTIAALATLFVLIPLCGLLLKRRPRDIGMLPDGAETESVAAIESGSEWSRKDALHTPALRGVMLCFGIGMMMQIGFLTHQVTLLSPILGTSGTATTVSATAVAALIGRLVLARFVDRINARKAAFWVLVLAAVSFVIMALFLTPAALVGGSVVFGLTIGNVTTLSPIIVRREFGAASFGAIFGIASCGIQLGTSLGPDFYGLLHDASGSYRLPLLLAAGMDFLAGIIIAIGRHGRPHAGA
jgi:MFS family permease